MSWGSWMRRDGIFVDGFLFVSWFGSQVDVGRRRGSLVS